MLKRTLFLLALLFMSGAAFAEDWNPGHINLQISDGEMKVGSVVQLTPSGGTPPYTLSISSPRQWTAQGLLHPPTVPQYEGGSCQVTLTIPNDLPGPFETSVDGRSFIWVTVVAYDAEGRSGSMTFRVFNELE